MDRIMDRIVDRTVDRLLRPSLALSAALVAGLLPTAAPAADFGPLRGSYGSTGLEPVVRWQGGYFAGFGGQSSSGLEANGSVGELIAQGLRQTVIEDEMRVSTWLEPSASGVSESTFGVLAGYNFQFSEAVLGIEADATLGTLRGAGSDSLSRFQTTSNGYTNFVTAEGSVSAEIQNWASLRARAGYTLGAFLPYVTGGLAVAQYELTRSARAYGRQERRDNNGVVLETIPFDTGVLGGGDSGVALGLAGGVGVDVALTQNVFLRGEWQYLFFPDVGGIEVDVSTVRGAAGVKF